MNALKYMLACSVAVAALSASPAIAQSTAAETTSSTDESTSREIIVTAQRREQTLLKVPQSISVVGGEDLERVQAKSFLDFAQLVPGLSVTQNTPGQARVILRGINTGSTASTVAIYGDDVPFGQSGSLANGGIVAGDFDTFDVARIEVLRGPQGTLYGSNSLGGVLKYITVAPKLRTFEGKGQGGVEFTDRGSTGYLGNLVVNVPLGDTVAVRASGFYHKTGGYVDVVGRNEKNANEAEVYGGRGSILFKPSDVFSIRLSALIQNIRADSPSSATVNPISFDFVSPITGLSTGGRQQRFERYTEFHNVDYRLYSGTLNYDFGFAALTSITSFGKLTQDQVSDISDNGARGLANIVYAPTAPNTVGIAFPSNVSSRKFTQEARLVSPNSETFEWLLGAYYTNEKARLDQEYLPFTLATQALIPPAVTLPPAFGGTSIQHLVIAELNSKYEEIAGYASGTVHFGPRFDLTLGGRYSHNKQSSFQQITVLGGGKPVLGNSAEGVFTWSVSPRFELSDNAAVYARVAKGYRPGGPNFIPAGAPAGFPSEFKADTLINYEIGVKAHTPDRTFGIDASVFYIDWNNILIVTSAIANGQPVGVNANGKKARTYGAEATATLRPTRGLNVALTMAYTKAYLRGDTVAGGGLNLSGGLDGDTLPYVPRYQANVSVDYDWNLSDRVHAYVGGNVHMQSDQKGAFSGAYRAAFGKPIELDGFQTVDLRAGADFGLFSVQLYARNLFNSAGLVNADGYPSTIPASIGGTGVPLLKVSSIRPRTLGATMGFKF